MKRVRRRLCRLVIGACIAGGLAALTTAGTAAADGIARPPGAIDGRGWELVSQPDKNSNQVAEGVVAAHGHDRVLYALQGGAPGIPGASQVPLLATRTSSGWVTASAIPARDDMLASRYESVATSPDLERIASAVYEGLGASVQFTTEKWLVRLDGGSQTTLHHFAQPGDTIAVVASDDLQRLYMSTQERIDPAKHAAGTRNVYDFGVDPPQLVSTMPGTGNGPTCGIPGHGAPGFAPWDVAQHKVSTDGRRVYFLSDGDVCDGRLGLFLHDRDAGQTTLVSGPPHGAAPDNGADDFVGATPDGALATYVTTTSLTAADSGDGDDADRDVYQYDVVHGTNTCVTCVVGQASVRGGDRYAGVSEDGTHVYFASQEQLAPGAIGGVDNAYVVEGGELDFVGVATDGVTSLLGLAASEVSRDGRFLVFASDHPAMDAISGAPNGGRRQYYRYDHVRADVVCVSCPPGGAATGDVVPQLIAKGMLVGADARSMTDDGGMVFFTTPDKLVPEDLNDDDDIYEWHDGNVGLISDGVTRRPFGGEPRVSSVSPDGRDVFFIDTSRLTWDAQDDLMKVYAARVGGGFLAPPPAPVPCVGDGCRAAPTPGPALRHPSSVETSGHGNVRPAKPVLVTSKVTRAQRKRLARRGRLVLRVRVGRPGRVSVVGQARVGKRIRRVARGATRVGRSGRGRIVVRLSRPARRWLARRGRLRVVLGVHYSQSPRAKRIVVPLRSTHKRGR